jgi:hypothetical protein
MLEFMVKHTGEVVVLFTFACVVPTFCICAIISQFQPQAPPEAMPEDETVE